VLVLAALATCFILSITLEGTFLSGIALKMRLFAKVKNRFFGVFSNDREGGMTGKVVDYVRSKKGS
jgi:hypothetical protein